jgi:5-methylcytosine-specific restriction endonuclease McrA
MEVLNTPVLVLNKNWTPIHIKSAKDAICDVVAECARVMDAENYSLHDWVPLRNEFGERICYCGDSNCGGWSSLPITDDAKAVHTTKMAIRVPEVIVLNEYDELPQLEIRLTRRNLLLRDNFKCQYCGEAVSNKDFTIDHVVPRSRGGPNSWDNFVVACFPCNIKKRDRTPKEAGLHLRTVPKKPNWYPLATRYTKNSPESWKRFLGDKVPVLG